MEMEYYRSSMLKYRDEINSLQILLSRTQAGPGRTVKQEQEEISPNHAQTINLISVANFVSFSRNRSPPRLRRVRRYAAEIMPEKKDIGVEYHASMNAPEQWK